MTSVPLETRQIIAGTSGESVECRGLSARAQREVGYPRVSIVVPTVNESQNLSPLLDRISLAMSGISYEVLIIDDDSKDGTFELCQQMMAWHPLRLYVRQNASRGLSGAVLEGLTRARGNFVVVMDADRAIACNEAMISSALVRIAPLRAMR